MMGGLYISVKRQRENNMHIYTYAIVKRTRKNSEILEWG